MGKTREDNGNSNRKSEATTTNKTKQKKIIVETEEERDVYTGSYDGCYHFHTKGALQEEWCL